MLISKVERTGSHKFCTLDEPDPTRRHETIYFNSNEGFGSCFRNKTEVKTK